LSRASLRIPRIIHQVWLGGSPLPAQQEAWRRTWRDHHPGWKLKIWGDDDLARSFTRPEVHERLRHPAERSDILRFEVLRLEGGVYVDTDFECLRPIDELLAGVEFFLADLKPGRTNNAVIGSVPGYPLIDEVLAGMRPTSIYGEDPKRGTGPHLVDALVAGRRREITVFPPGIFYPSTPEQRTSAYAIHHSARSWVDVDGLRYRLRKAEERVLEAEAERLRARSDLDAVLHGNLPRRLAVALRRRH
jgi:inositol phosphorylceramide mannosyltransferase catalytic subunit